MRALQRRTMGVCCAAAMALAGSSAAAHPDVLNIVSWGGVYTASQMEAYVNPYRDRTDQPVEVDRYSGGLENIRNQVTAKNVKWDVVDMGLSNAVRGCEQGLLEKIDHSQLPAGRDGSSPQEDFLADMLPDCAVGQNVFSNVVAYNTEAFQDDAPDSVEDFFDTRSYPGRRGMRQNPRGNLELALLADGVEPDRVYEVLSTEEGVERAFDKLRSIAPSIVWWDGAEDPQLLLERGQAAMTTGFNARIQAAIDNQDQPFEIIWDGQTYNYELWTIVKGSPHKQAALDFVKFASQPERQAAQANAIAYGPARKSAMSLVSDSMRSKLPTAEQNLQNALRIDHEFWAEHQDALSDRFDAFVKEAKDMGGSDTFGVGTPR